MRVSFIANPTAGRGRTRALVEGYARAVRGDVQLLWTQGPSHASDLARTAAAASEIICAVGGDGTVSEVVNGLMPRPVPIVVIPTGSGNDFASLLDCPRSAEELRQVIEDGIGLRLDVIDCGGRYCANSIGIGFEAMVTYHSLGIRRLRGLPLYLTAVVKALAAYECGHFTLSVDDATVAGDFLLVSAGNGVRSGGGFYLNPRAYPDDGLIDVCVARRMSRARMLSILPSALRGAHVGKPGIDVFRGARVSVAADRPFPIHIDGEYLGRRETPLVLRIVPRCLPVLTRRGGKARHVGPLERVVGAV
jgi:YegS/Rv2252/BmrU family lipid kinase